MLVGARTSHVPTCVDFEGHFFQHVFRVAVPSAASWEYATALLDNLILGSVWGQAIQEVFEGEEA
jgi:hypothetical protein